MSEKEDRFVRIAKRHRKITSKKVQAYDLDDAHIHLDMIGDTLETLKTKIALLEDIEEELRDLHGLAGELYRGRPLAKLLGLDNNPFHSFLGIGKVPEGDAGRHDLSSIIQELKNADFYIAKAKELENQVASSV